MKHKYSFSEWVLFFALMVLANRISDWFENWLHH